MEADGIKVMVKTIEKLQGNTENLNKVVLILNSVLTSLPDDLVALKIVQEKTVPYLVNYI